MTAAGSRRLRILTRLCDDGSTGLATERLCRVGTEVTGMSGAGMMLMADDVAQGMLCATDDVSARIEELQFVLGEGPCVDAHHGGRPVIEDDLAQPDDARWPAFSGPATEAGAGAIFAFPLRVGPVHLGAMDLYRDRAGGLTDDQHADAQAVADVAAEAILLLQSGATPVTVAHDLAAGTDLRLVVHQASGMVAVQLDTTVDEALCRLRAHAFAHDLPLVTVARSVVDRTLRFDDGEAEGGGRE